MPRGVTEDGQVTSRDPYAGQQFDNYWESITDDDKRLLRQVDFEEKLGREAVLDKISEHLRRLKLYNNQRRDKNAVGDPLLYTVFQTIFASLYSDRLDVEFEPNDQGDEETADNLNALAKFDYKKMGKSKIDYTTIFDACFFGYSLRDMTTFNRKKQIPTPTNIDPLSFMRDPDATSINGDVSGKGAAGYFGHEVEMTKQEMEEHPAFTDFEGLAIRDNDISLMEEAQKERNDAQGRADASDAELNLKEYDNRKYKLLRWFTHFGGQKVIVYTGKGRDNKRRIVGRQTIGKFTERWPINYVCFSPLPNDFDGVSIPDLVEDKQRQRAVMLNLAIAGIKSTIMPMYIFDENLIDNPNELDFQTNKAVGVDGNPNQAAIPLQKADIRVDMVNYVLETLDGSAQRATATPEIQQGQVSGQDRTLGELNLVAQKVDTRYSLTAKIFGWGEEEFWSMWYVSYKKNFKSLIDEKVIRIKGSGGYRWRPLTKENIVADIDPDINIESRYVSETKKARDRQYQMEFIKLVLQDPSSNKRYALKTLAKLNGYDREQIDYLYPPTVDEYMAEDENLTLEQGDMPSINKDDDHYTHILVHSKAADNEEKFAHIEAHKKALVLKKTNPELFAQNQGTDAQGNPIPTDAQQQQPGQAPGGQPPAAGGAAAQPGMSAAGAGLQAPSQLQ